MKCKKLAKSITHWSRRFLSACISSAINGMMVFFRWSSCSQSLISKETYPQQRRQLPTVTTTKWFPNIFVTISCETCSLSLFLVISFFNHSTTSLPLAHQGISALVSGFSLNHTQIFFVFFPLTSVGKHFKFYQIECGDPLRPTSTHSL